MAGITDLKVVYGKGATGEEKYTVIPTDLNSGAKGEYVYLAYSKDTSFGEPITAIQVAASGDENDPACIPPGYTKVQGDLSKGARGKYIYVSYVKGTTPNPVTDVEVIVGTKQWIWPKKDYIRINQDCNQGAGGNYVYIVYKY